ncbi:RagB/SusD family nutrient uptake outer membrane protein [Sphingobacterium phlebotomi]|uniref:RagB/SusD family nutrient uptake outer membrane protein n=1 Tax=Sphingobacterium phlebotomi TaxID=2605433 RepID=A0A5D4GW53_9SPHI|nr:RagB/SusD family nutrient uptake outer membrane protein [Sphingobacterium phlebotomi]TYR32557.1 RagB/SusD family nutrient uptake outer membrane protein [Sphingobacterium phlebotomi]
MMNKKVIQRIISSITVAFAVTVMVSCNKWLDVRPSNQFDEDEQFSTEQGYIDVLIGTYQSMTDEATYGAELSFRFVDVLAQLYGNKSSGTDYYRLSATYAYTQANNNQHSPRTIIENIWSKQYNSIAQLNYLLKRLDTRPAELTEANYKLIKGEALALRAFLHFDLLRSFAPAYSEATVGKKTIPYVTEFTVSPSNVLTFTDVVDRMETDLQEAIDLQSGFQEIDQIIDNQGTTSSGLFDMFRQNRMNYWAAKALLARMYLYIGDKVNAKKYADEVIDSGQFRFIPTANRIFDERDSLSNISFTQEHIFSLYHSGLRNVADNFFKTTALNPEGSDLFNTKPVLDGIYESAGEGLGSDIRSTIASPSRWSEHNTSAVYTKKYYSDHARNVNQRLIPLIRLPEMYYIAAEASTNMSEALEYLNAVRDARNISTMLTNENVSDETAFRNELFKEYRKEYYAEGHLWYFYKRLAYTSLPNTVFYNNMASVYTFPIPDGELEFNPDYN